MKALVENLVGIASFIAVVAVAYIFASLGVLLYNLLENGVCV